MQKYQATSVAGKKKSTLDKTHVLLKATDDLVLGAWYQVESNEKANLSVGMTITMLNGRKRIHGTITSLGNTFFHSHDLKRFKKD
jgi:hypothetical protein